ncbi:Kremen protein 1 [Trichoplax sp. H2]|nr:Kremen protein 1 [Trichoplax sp. H2]|eukprot:RDD40862.1 Kremen protein 1 [Trichoplax sp. H2]
MDLKLVIKLNIFSIFALLAINVVYSAHLDDFECYNPGTRGSDYFGHKNVTRNGNRCYRWSQLIILPYGVQPYKHNFCRNDNHRYGGPWCFINEHIWDYCGIPSCLFIHEKRNRYPATLPKLPLLYNKPQILVKTKALIITATVARTTTTTKTVTETKLMPSAVPRIETTTIISTVVQPTPVPSIPTSIQVITITPSDVPPVILRTTIVSPISTTITSTHTAFMNVTVTKFLSTEPLTTVTEYQTVTLLHNEYGPGFGERSQIDY